MEEKLGTERTLKFRDRVIALIEKEFTISKTEFMRRGIDSRADIHKMPRHVYFYALEEMRALTGTKAIYLSRLTGWSRAALKHSHEYTLNVLTNDPEYKQRANNCINAIRGLLDVHVKCVYK